MAAVDSSRSKRSSWSPSVSQDSKENQAGVGILFVEEEDPSGFVRVTVKALIEGGSAEKTGQVKSGDMVVRVGNQDVIGKPLSILRTMIPGPIGSYCKLGFLRGGVALNSNAVQEKSTYYDVQLVRQPTKNEKKKLVTGEAIGPDAGENSPIVSSSAPYLQSKSGASISSTDSKSLPISAPRPPLSIAQPPVSREAAGPWASSNLKPSPPVLWTPENDRGKAWSSNGQFITPSSPVQRERAQPVEQSAAASSLSPNSSALSSAVEAAMSNVDKALYDMQNREIDRLRSKLEASEREMTRCKEELLKEEARRRDLEERYQSLEKKSRAVQAYPSYRSNSEVRSPEITQLQQQLEAAKQDKQLETYKRIELENNLKAAERTLLATQNASKDAVSDPRIVQLEQRLSMSEEKRREEEKKRAILEGKVRHLENVAKQQSPFKFQNMNKGRKGPPPHMPDIAEGREEIATANLSVGSSGSMRSPTLAAIDGPVPAALAKWGNEGVYLHMGGIQTNMPGVQQGGMPDLYSSQNGIVSNGYPALNPKLAMHAQAPANQGIQGPPQHSNMAVRNGIPSAMQQQQRAPGIQSSAMQQPGLQQPGMQHGGAVPQTAYKQGSFGKVNAGRIQGLPMQGLQMQQQQLQDVSIFLCMHVESN
eukprot:CAMPEP_0172193324 /NCGR_PEP_ID=MMETSP1050-20130122/24886_1 /TAXON_ID=233186 /ORGANISM="Cryptomonas curvata, Strain CCAP979/52" /LENGTH=648 /DNA_ID=CAMNT_0012868857 /DNA_START=57 /DNA_END=2003 /DNA_ORIENTATION=-